jgi:hypothetical protein
MAKHKWEPDAVPYALRRMVATDHTLGACIASGLYEIFKKSGKKLVRIIRRIERRGRIGNSTDVVCKRLCCKFRLHNVTIFFFNLGNSLITPFKFRQIFPRVLWLGLQIIISNF